MTKVKDGFYKNIAGAIGNDDYVLLAGGGHKSESLLSVAYSANSDKLDGKHITELFTDFSNAGSQTTSITIGGTNRTLKIDADTLDGYHANSFALAHSHPYLPLAGGTMNSGAIITLPSNSSIRQTQADTSNYTTPLIWLKNGTGWYSSGSTLYTYQPQIGQHNTGDTYGTICILPYATDSAPWGGTVGLFIGKTILKWENKDILHTGNISPQLLINGNTIASKVGGVTSSYITVPYATNAGNADNAVDAMYLKSMGNYVFSNISTDVPTNKVSFKIINSGGNVLGDSQYEVLHLPWSSSDYGTYLLFGANNGRFGIKFKHGGSVREVHTSDRSYVSGGKGYLLGTEITQVNNADTVDGYHAGVQNGQVSIFVSWPSIATMQSEGLLTTNYGTSSYGHPDEEYLQAICKWAIAHYTNLGDITLIGSIAPNSSGTCIMHLYSSSGKDSTTLLPRYCASTYQTLSGPIYEFGCSNYNWYYRRLSAGNADTVDGKHANEFATSGHTHDDKYYTESESDDRFVNVTGDTMTGRLVNMGIVTGATEINFDCDAIVIAPKATRNGAAGIYYPGLAFNHMWNYNGGTGYNNSPQGWIGLRLVDTPGSERSSLVFATKPGTGTSNTGNDRPIERMCITPAGNVGIGVKSPSCKLHIVGVNGETLRLSMPSNNYTAGAGPSLSFVHGENGEMLGWIRGIFNESSQGNRGNLQFATRTSDAAGPEVKMTILHNGNVGIGKSDPTDKLDVYGNIVVSLPDWNNNYGIYINEGNSESYGFNILYGSSDKFTIQRRDGSTTGITVLQMSRSDSDTYFGGAVNPLSNNSYSLGNSTNKWTGVYAYTLYAYSTTPIVFYGSGTGTYNQSVFIVNTNGVTLETPRASNDSNANILPFYIKTRGGQYSPIYAKKFVTENGTSSQFVKGDGSLDSNTYALNSALGNYLPLAGGTMTGIINWGTGATREILQFTTDSTWKSGLRYSWSNSTTVSLWGKHKDTAFVWNAGTDTEINGHSSTVYDFRIRRESDVVTARISGNKIWHEGNDGSGSGLDADLLDGLHATSFLGWECMKNVGSGSPFSDAVTFFNNLSNLNNGGKILYNQYGAEYTMLFTRRNDSTAHGSILKWGYTDKYIRIIRMISGSAQSTDWEKISAGYADSAGNADTVDGYHASSFATSGHTHTFASITNKITAGNEFNFVDTEQSTIWFNYRRASGNAATTATTYFNFGQGTNSATYAYLRANGFIKNSSSDSYVLLGGGGDKALSDFLRKVTVANNTTNDFNSFENMTLTGRGDPTTGASLSNAPWSGSGPAGGYGVLTYLWSGYGTQMAWGYGSNDIFIRYRYWTSNGTIWSTTWDKILHTGNWTGVIDGRYLPLDGGWMNTDAIINFRGINSSTSAYTKMGYMSTTPHGLKMHLGSDSYNTKAFYITSTGYDAANDHGGIAIDNDGVTAFGAGDTGSVFRVLNEDNVNDGAQFLVTKSSGAAIKYNLSVGQNTINTDYRLFVNGHIFTNGALYISNNTNSSTNGIIFSTSKQIYHNGIYNECNIGLFGYNSIFNGLKDNVSYVEYYNGSSWVAWQQSSSYTFMNPAFDGLRRGNGVSIDYTHRRFRIIVETASPYCGNGYLCFRLSWWNHGTMETSGSNIVPLKVSLDWGNANSSSATFTNIFTDITTTALPEGYYLIPCTLHYEGMRSIRLTIQIPSWTNTGNSTSLCDVVFASWFGGRSYQSSYSLSSHTHDDRYYTESESDSRFVNVTGDTMTGDLKIDGTNNLSHGPWDHGIIAGADGHSKVVMSYLASSTNGAVIGAHNSGLTAWDILNVAGTQLIFRINETEKMRLNNSGNFGIGNSSPSYKLHVAGDIAVSTESCFIGYMPRKKSGGGGWAYNAFQIKDYAGTDFAHLGVYGGDNSLTYIYIGSNNYDSTSNLKIDTSGYTTAIGYKKVNSSNSYVLLGGGGHKAVSDFATSGHNHDGRYLRYEGWWTSGSGQSVDDQHGMNFTYTDHGAPHHWGITTTFEESRGSSYRLQIHGTGDNYLYFRNRSADYSGWHSSGWKQILTNTDTYVSSNKGYINNTEITYVNSAGNADTTDGLHAHSGRNNEVNKLVRTDGNGYIQAGWINTTSGDMGTTAIDRVYCSNDGYIRYKTKANFAYELRDSGYLDGRYLPLAGGTMNSGAQITVGTITNSSGQVYSGGIQLRELNYSGTNVTDNYENAPGITFHWGGRWVYKLNLHSNDLYWSNNKVWHAGNDGSGSGLDADLLDGLHGSSFVKFYLSPMSSNAPADSAKSWFINNMPSGSGAIIYNVPGSEKTIIAGKSTGSYGHMLQINYDDNYLRILRYKASAWQSTDWEKISAGYADSAGNADIASRLKGATGSVDPNDMTHNRLYYYSSESTNRPSDNWGLLFNMSNRDVASPGTDQHWLSQLAFAHNGEIYYRYRVNTNAWNSWVKLITANNISSYASNISHQRVNDATTRYVLGTTLTANGSLSTVYSVSQFYFTNGGAYHTSDISLKYDIRDLLNNDVIDLFKTENGYIRYFKWKDFDNESYGFIAQELEEYCPEAIDLNKDDNLLHVNYNVAFAKIIGAMFKKIKEQDKIIKELKEKVLH